MAFSLSKLLEPEEFVGELWHRLIAKPTDLPRFPEAVVTFTSVQRQLGPFFRALGGEKGVELKAQGLETSHTRLGWRHRLGHSAFQVPRARFDGDTLLLPEELDVFPSPDLNRDLYFWLAAWAAGINGDSGRSAQDSCAEARAVPARSPAQTRDSSLECGISPRPLPATQIMEPSGREGARTSSGTPPHPEAHADPLRADIAALRFGWHMSRRVLFFAPGLKARYRRLCAAALDIRPERKLPETEQMVEDAIRALLRAADALPPEEETTANPILAAIVESGTPSKNSPIDGYSDFSSNDSCAETHAVPAHSPTQPPDMVGKWLGGGVGLAAIPMAEADLSTFSAPRGYHPFLPVPLWGDAVPRRLDVRHQRPDDAEAGSREAPAEEDRDRKWRAKRESGEKAKRKDPLILHRFEALLSIAEFLNLSRLVDDETDEEEAKKARDDVDELSLVDVKKRPKTRLAFDLDLAPEDVERERLSGRHTYPEWDYRAQAYLPDHCRVLTSVAEEAEDDTWQPDADMRRRIRQVKRQFEALRPKRELLRRQLDGTELDADALVRSISELKAHGEGSERIWMQHLPQSRDLSVAVLFDTSRSTESWVQGRQVIDIARETLLALAAGLEACGDDHAIYSFSSIRHERVFVQTIMDFDERFGEAIIRRVAALRPGFYTRLGAAIRHASAQLAQRPASRQLLLVITDGKPNDLDHYEGRYGVEDTRMAVREARMAGQKVFGVTIDRKAREYFGHIFGRHGHAIVSRPSRLAQALPRLYRHLIM